MDPLPKTFAFAVFAAVSLMSASAEARITALSLCERQLDECLRRALIPKPCDWRYEECMRQSFYAPIARAAIGSPR